MKRVLSCLQAIMAGVALMAFVDIQAGQPIPITADEAFDAIMDESANDVALVDLRDPVEYFWSGAPVAVKMIHFADGDGKTAPVEPDNGKVRLIKEGKFLEYTLGGQYRRTQVDKINYLETKQVAINIPFRIGIPNSWMPNPSFQSDMNRLYSFGIRVVILYCRTGGRSSMAGASITTPFDAIYEIDDPAGANQYGGFSGSGYYTGIADNTGPYNGYLGFPGRQTDRQDVSSVSWSDSGLPIATMVQPIPLPLLPPLPVP